jgi:protein phosphatase
MLKIFNRSGVEAEGSPAPTAEVPPIEAPEPGPEPETPAPSVFDATAEPLPLSPQVLAEFEAEFGPAEEAPEPEAGQGWREGELEEWVEPLESETVESLELDTALETPAGLIRITAWASTLGGHNLYTAAPGPDAETLPATLRLREAAGAGAERLRREVEWRRALDGAGRFAMLPAVLASFEHEGRFYVLEESPPAEPTLAARLQEGIFDEMALGEVLLVLVQAAAFLVRLHAAGYAHLSLRPEIILPGKPMQVLDASFALPLGSPLGAPLSFCGYSPPELAQPGIAEARSDIYAVGAMLYRAVTGMDVPETGVDFHTWQPKMVVAGVPQLLRRCLGATVSRYTGAEELHRDLVRLKNRLRPQTILNVTGATTIGLEPSRSTNQDAYGYISGNWESDSGPVAWTAFCVADGMGGMAAGEVASELAVQAFLGAASAWAARGPWRIPAADQANLVREWSQAANEAVVRELDSRCARGGCTLDAGLVLDRRLCTAHVGDSRLYLLRGGEYQLLSRDHSYVMSLVLQGEIKFEDIRTHSDRNKVTRSLGERHPQPDYFTDTLAVTANAPSLDLQAGDVLLACSDGLWEPVLEAEMLAALEGEPNLNHAAREMLRLALKRGAPDNATVVLLRVEEWGAAMFG